MRVRVRSESESERGTAGAAVSFFSGAIVLGDARAKGFDGGCEDGDDLAAKISAQLDRVGRQPMLQALVAAHRFLSGAPSNDEKLHIFLSASSAVALLDVRGDGVGTGKLL